MPLSPLIRPLSPLQTQSAPSLPAPYNLADAVLAPCRLAEHGEVDAPQSLLSSAAFPLSTASFQAAPPKHKEMNRASARNSAGGVSRTPSESPYPTSHGVDNALMGNTVEPRVSEPQPICVSSQASLEHRRRVAPPSTSPLPVAPAGSRPPTFSHRASPTSAVAAAAAVPPSSHPYLDEPQASSQLIKRRAHTSRAVQRQPQHHRSAVRQAAAPSSALVRDDTSTALLHASTADVSVAAAQPSYGASLLRHASSPSAPGSPNVARRCASTSPTAPLLLVEHRDAHRHFPSGISQSGLGGAAATTVGLTRDDDDEGECEGAEDETGNVYHGTAVSTRTGRRYHISIEAALLDSEAVSSPSLSSGSPGRTTSRTITSALCTRDNTQHEKEDTDSGSEVAAGASHFAAAATTTTAAAAHTAPAEREARTDAGALQNGKEGRRSPSAPHTRRVSPSRSTPSVSFVPLSPKKAVSAEASPWTHGYHPRYVYPAQEDCERLLREIEAQSPLMRRCLTPPRPLNKAAVAGGEGATSISSASSLPAHRSSAGHLSAGEEARRIYHWDLHTAAEDLSYTEGAFQQSPERFATSTARQLQRLQKAGSRLYGASSSVSAIIGGGGGSGRQNTEQTFPASCSSWSANSAAAAANCSIPSQNAAESPSQRLQRLLRETDAAFPLLWRATHAADVASPTVSEPRASGGPDSDSAVLLTPSPSSIQPVKREGRDGASDGLEETTSSVKAQGSAFALSRLNAPSGTSSVVEMPMRIAVAAMTPARPLSRQTVAASEDSSGGAALQLRRR